MARDSFARKVQQMAEVLKILGHAVRLTVVINSLENPDGITASDAFPDDMQPPNRGPHVKKLRLLIETERESKIADAIYSIPPYLRRPLREAVDAVERLTRAVFDKREQAPSVTVSMNEKGEYFVDGKPVDTKKFAAEIKRVLQSR